MRNVVFSPYSVLTLLAIAANASAGESREQIVRALGADSYESLLSSTEWRYLENDFFTGFAKPYKANCSYVALLPKKAKIEVNRKGTRATAVTMGVMVEGCAPDF